MASSARYQRLDPVRDDDDDHDDDESPAASARRQMQLLRPHVEAHRAPLLTAANEEDEERLPEGMERIGYDADEQRYLYRDADGSEWEGQPGNRYGQLHRVGQRPSVEGVSATELAAQERAAWRYFLPFLLLVGAFLLFVFRITRGGGDSDARPTCADKNAALHNIVRGDTCYDIAQGRGIDVPTLEKANEDLDCDNLPIGRWICVPEGSAKIDGSGKMKLRWTS